MGTIKEAVAVDKTVRCLCRGSHHQLTREDERGPSMRLRRVRYVDRRRTCAVVLPSHVCEVVVLYLSLRAHRSAVAHLDVDEKRRSELD